MGVRFGCHACGRRLNIKSELAGRRGKCPSCGVRFRIPLDDTEFSIPLEDKPQPATAAANVAASGSSPQSAVDPDAAFDEFVNEATAAEPESPAAPAPTPVNSPTTSQHASAGDATAQAETPGRRFAILDEDPAAQWYVRPKSGGQYGPASGDLLYEWIDQGRVGTSALLWRDGWAQWRGAEEVLPEMNAASNPTGGNSASPTIQPERPPAPQAAVPSISVETEASTPAEPEPTTPDPGAVRSKRKSRRMLMIGLLLAVCALLVGGLIYAVVAS